MRLFCISLSHLTDNTALLQHINERRYSFCVAIMLLHCTSDWLHQQTYGKFSPAHFSPYWVLQGLFLEDRLKLP